MLAPIAIGTIRTVVPTFIGVLLAYVAQKSGFDFTNQSEALTSGVVAVLTGGYYSLATWLERRVNPRFGWLLGVPRPPSYLAEHKGEPDPTDGPTLGGETFGINEAEKPDESTPQDDEAKEE